MSVRLPIKQEGASFRFVCELEEGVSYSIGLRWNDRDGAWYMEVGDTNGVAILSGIKVVLGVLLLGHATSKLLPPGDFMAIDTTGRDQEAAFEDIGRRVQITYFTSAELSAG